MTDARSLGVVVPRGATRLEQASTFPEGVAAEPIATGANAAVFGPGEPEAEVATTLLAEANSVRDELRGAVSRWRRLRSDIDIRPLLERDRAIRTTKRSLPSLPSLRRPRGAEGSV